MKNKSSHLSHPDTSSTKAKAETYILTLPLWGNYGGLLQAWAMQKAADSLLVKKSRIWLQKAPKREMPYMHNIWKRLIKNLHHRRNVISKSLRGRKERAEMSLYYLSREKQLMQFYHALGLTTKKIKNTGSERFIVGSDQVWRKRYAGADGLYFLNRNSEECRRNSITYAASFGTGEWEGNNEETERCGRLLRQFKAVSVREHSGVDICREQFGVDAVQMPDPTLLMTVEQYNKLIAKEKTQSPLKNYIATYLLDRNDGVEESMKAISEEKQLELQELSESASAAQLCNRLPMTVAQWLRYIRDAEYVLTDSFHGCVFSIIFNKPFVCYGNPMRGSSRFDTLLQTFHLESRMVNTPEQAAEVLRMPICWEEVNRIHEHERQRGLNFLRENLT